MVDFYNAVIRELSGTIDGVNYTFSAPTAFLAGTFRLMVNGQVYSPTDDEYGWSELTTTVIEMTKPPLAGDVLQGFYQESGNYTPNLDNVVGSPFHPTGALP